MMELDPQQQSAVESTSRKALVLAGAGSGKTRVLIERIAHLVETQKVSPYEVMAFTFTRKAAGEIKSRLVDRIGNQAYRVTMGTMHSIGLNFIQRFGESLNLTPGHLTVYGEWESSFLLKEVAWEMGLFKGRSWKIPKKEIDQVFSDYYERGVEPDPLHKAFGLFRAFMGVCRENNALTYGSILTHLEKLIPVLSKHLHIRHILVDEVQDIDPLQWRIINTLCEACGAALFVVGDIDQSIYSFRGAVPEYLVDHQTDFDVYRLETNYRSHAGIVDAANELISHNRKRLDKTMVAGRQEQGNESFGSGVFVFRDVDSREIVNAAATMMTGIDEFLADASMPIAVLARNHVLLKKTAQIMLDLDIPHTYIGQKTALTNSEEFRRFHAFLKLIVNPYDNFSFLLIKDLVGLTNEDYADIRLSAAREGVSHFQWWYENNHGGFNTVADFFSFNFSLPAGSLANAAFEIRGMATGAYPNPEPGWDFDVDETFKFVFQWLSDHPGGSETQIADYLNWLATYSVQDEISEKSEGVQLMTIHAAKGLEWPIVIVAGCNEGILPGKQAVREDDIEGERRLAYVAWTRAQDQLILTVRPEQSESNGRVYQNPASRFIRESKAFHPRDFCTCYEGVEDPECPIHGTDPY